MKGGSGDGDDDDGAHAGDGAGVSGPEGPCRRGDVYLASPCLPLGEAGSPDV